MVMDRPPTVARGVKALRLTAVLLTFVFLGLQGCGCCDDMLPPGGDECCCTFEWVHEQTNFPNATVNIVLVGANPTLGAVAVPTQLVGVNPLVPQVFQICVQSDHALGASVTVEFREQNTNSLMGAALLTYDEQCTPGIELLTPRIAVYSTDCGGTPPDCCCDYLWRVPQGATGANIVVRAETVDPTLVPVTITPNTFNNVLFDEFLAFEICVNFLHDVGASMTLVVEDADSGFDYGLYLLTFDERCEPEISPLQTSGQPTLLSPDCGPPCCCNFSWEILGELDGVDIEIQTANVDVTLMPTVVPNMFDNVSFGQVVNFQVCVEVGHAIGATMELVIVDRNSGAGYDRVFLTYDDTCRPSLFEEPNNPGAGVFQAICIP